MLSEQPSVSFLAELPLGYALSPPQHIILSLAHSHGGIIKRKRILAAKMSKNHPRIYIYILFQAMVLIMGWGSFRHFLLWHLLFLVALIRKGRRGGTGTDLSRNLEASTLPTEVCTVGFLRAGTFLCVPDEVYKLITLPPSSSRQIIFLPLLVAATFTSSEVGYQRVSCQLYPHAKCLVQMILVQFTASYLVCRNVVIRHIPVFWNTLAPP